jgi:hypothetical protein
MEAMPAKGWSSSRAVLIGSDRNLQPMGRIHVIGIEKATTLDGAQYMGVEP